MDDRFEIGTDGAFEEIAVDSVDELLTLLRKSHPMWRAGVGPSGVDWPRSNWVFRGHADADWKLMPKAWRSHDDAQGAVYASLEPPAEQLLEKAVLDFHPDGFELPEDDRALFRALLQHTLCERKMVEEFLRFADELGMDVPETRDWDAELWAFGMPYAPEVLPPAELDEDALVDTFREGFLQGIQDLTLPSEHGALAQHHGIRTRLLDWTRDPIVAAFFAADPATNATAFAVYALQVPSGNIWLELVAVPRASSAFLHAQSGVFTVCKHLTAERHFLKDGAWPPLEILHAEFLEWEKEFREEGEGLRTPVARLKKIVVPAKCAAELAERLLMDGVSRAHLMPTLDNVAAVVNQRWASLAD